MPEKSRYFIAKNIITGLCWNGASFAGKCLQEAVMFSEPTKAVLNYSFENCVFFEITFERL